MNYRHCQYIVTSIVLAMPAVALGDGVSIDRIYDPYVQQTEKELEFRALIHNDSDPMQDDNQRFKLGYGQSLSDSWFTEIYAVGHRKSDQSLQLDAYEIEFKWQLTEQGEYDNDWGLMFELERETVENAWEQSTTLIMLHQWRRWVGTLNASLSYQWGTTIDNEFSTAMAAQLHYRYKPSLEPGLELHLSADTTAIGPSLAGKLRLGGRKQLFWSTALLAGFNHTTPDISLNFNLEYEF